MAEFASIYGKDFHNGVTNRDWVAPDSNYSLYAGYRVGKNNWVMCIRFELKSTAKSISLHFCNGAELPRLPTLRYKFTSQEDESLQNASYNTEGEGTFTLAKRTEYGSSDITIEKTLPAGTHYMYIWTDNSVEGNYMLTRFYGGDYGFRASYEEMLSLVYIANGSEVVAYEAYIDNGAGWDLFAVNEDNGTGWDACG